MIPTQRCTMAVKGRFVSSAILIFTCLTVVSANNPPALMHFRSNIFLSEKTTVGTVITTLTARDSDGPSSLTFDTASPETGYLVRLSPPRPAGPHAKQADVILKVALDSDFLPVTISLYISDVNDNHPQFQNLPGIAAIDENIGPGDTVFHVKATDPDGGTGGVVSFSLQNDYNKTFSLDKYYGNLTLLKALDYETLSLYRLNITATDGGGLSNQGELRVVVVDVQDTPPSFLQHAYTPHIPEHSPPGTTVVKVMAYDGDLGNSNPLQYRITNESCGGLFALDANTGAVTVRTTPDREKDPVKREDGICLLNITAAETPLHLPQLGRSTSWVTVAVNVDDVNDHHPVFSASSVSAWTARDVPDYTPVGFLSPFTLSVSDGDQGENGLLELSVRTLGGLQDDVFGVLPTQVHSLAQVMLHVSNASALRSHRLHRISIQVTAREKMTVSRFSSVATIEVRVGNSSCSHASP